jgi:peptidoglycan biosynthesis protein MviN/MurJ (putative lipid II flippase)
VAFLPFPVLVAVTSVFAAAQYAMGRFAGTTASLGLRAGGGMALALLADDGQRLVAAAVGLSVGEALRLVLLVLTLPRDAVPWRRGWGRAHEAGRTFLRTSSPTMAAALIVAVNPLIAKTIATRLGPGATTLIELAEKLFYIPMVLLVAAVSRVSATVWAHRVHDPEGLRADFWRVQRIGALVTAGVATAGAVVMLVGRPLVGSLLGLPADSPFALVFVLFIVGLPLALAGDLSGTMLITLRRTGVLPALAAVLVVVNLGTTVVGAQHLDVVGVALAGTVVRVLNAAALLYFAWGLLRAGTGPPADVSPAATRPAPPRTGPAGD